MRNSLLRRTSRRAGLAVAPLAAAALLVAVPAAQARPGQPAAGTVGGVHQRLAAISAKVDGLIARMTLAEHRRLLVVGGWLSLLAATTLIDLHRAQAAGAEHSLVVGAGAESTALHRHPRRGRHVPDKVETVGRGYLIGANQCAHRSHTQPTCANCAEHPL